MRDFAKQNSSVDAKSFLFSSVLISLSLFSVQRNVKKGQHKMGKGFQVGSGTLIHVLDISISEFQIRPRLRKKKGTENSQISWNSLFCLSPTFHFSHFPPSSSFSLARSKR